MKKKYQVIYDSTTNDLFEVHKNDGTKHVCMLSLNGPFFVSAKNNVATALVRTVEDKISKYTVREYSSATIAQHFATLQVGKILKTS